MSRNIKQYHQSSYIPVMNTWLCVTCYVDVLKVLCRHGRRRLKVSLNISRLIFRQKPLSVLADLSIFRMFYFDFSNIFLFIAPLLRNKHAGNSKFSVFLIASYSPWSVTTLDTNGTSEIISRKNNLSFRRSSSIHVWNVIIRWIVTFIIRLTNW